MKAALKETDYCTEMCGYVNIWAPYLQDGKGNPRTVLRGLSHAINRSLKFPNGKWNSGNPLGVLSRFHKAPREIGTYTRRKKDMAKKLAII